MQELSRFLVVLFFFVATNPSATAQHISFLRAERISPTSLSSRVSVPFNSGVVVIDLPQNALRLPNYENHHQRRSRRLKSEPTRHHKSETTNSHQLNQRSPSFDASNFELLTPFMTSGSSQTPWTPVTSESKLYRPRKSKPKFNGNQN